MAPANSRAYTSVADCLESLGLQTYGLEREDPNIRLRKVVFKDKSVKRLYELEISTLYGFLLQDKLHRDDPHLFDKELDFILQRYGPLIWPETNKGSRDHLRQPHRDTRYPRHLVFPEDSVKIKEGLRWTVLCKRTRPDGDIGRFIKQNAKVWKFRNDLCTSPDSVLKRRQLRSTSDGARQNTEMDSEDEESSDLGQSNDVDIETRRQTRSKRKHSAEMTSKVELRLYQVIKKNSSPGHSPIHPHGSIHLEDNQITADDCFSQICAHIETDCSFMVFQFPEDMSRKPRVRIDRGEIEAEDTFKEVLKALKAAVRFPDNPHPRSVEVEVGLED